MIQLTRHMIQMLEEVYLITTEVCLVSYLATIRHS